MAPGPSRLTRAGLTSIAPTTDCEATSKRATVPACALATIATSIEAGWFRGVAATKSSVPQTSASTALVIPASPRIMLVSLSLQERYWLIKILTRAGEDLDENVGAVSRAFLLLGVVLDNRSRSSWLLVSAGSLTEWHDPNGAGVGVTVTMLWFFAFALSAGAPLLAYWLTRRRSTPGRVALAIWLPALVLIGVTAVGFMISPP